MHFGTFLCHLQDCDVNCPKFMFYGYNDKFFFVLLNLDLSLRIRLQENSPTIDKFSELK